MTNKSVVAGRGLYRVYVRYFISNVDADATYQWMDLGKVTCGPGKVGEFCANWDRVMNLLLRPPPPDFVLHNILRQVREDRSMTRIMYRYKRVREWAKSHRIGGRSCLRLAAERSPYGARDRPPSCYALREAGFIRSQVATQQAGGSSDT